MKAPDGKEIMVKYYFAEHCDMDDWLDKHPEYKMVDYKFTFQFSYILYYTEKQQDDWKINRPTTKDKQINLYIKEKR